MMEIISSIIINICLIILYFYLVKENKENKKYINILENNLITEAKKNEILKESYKRLDKEVRDIKSNFGNLKKTVKIINNGVVQ